jgi:ABC-type cobalt transport system substrate-binding protein
MGRRTYAIELRNAVDCQVFPDEIRKVEVRRGNPTYNKWCKGIFSPPDGQMERYGHKVRRSI